MTIAWPSFLPAPLLDGYELQRQKGAIRTDMDSGPARVRRRFTRVPTRIPQAWLLTTKEFGMFEWWFEKTLDGGAAWFEGPAKNGTGLPTVQLRFVDQGNGPYTARPVSAAYWQVQALLEVDQMPLGNLIDYWPEGEPTLDLDFATETYGVAG